jgi:cytochrome c-type biogenesis protein CcmH/NrfF
MKLEKIMKIVNEIIKEMIDEYKEVDLPPSSKHTALVWGIAILLIIVAIGITMSENEVI